ncbi:MAG: D-alanine--D-alanine ligase [Alphaproteobacteria bacterium]|nr:D-alanine--D-alanine ligase [Alphaproteobacteria bacterium]
MTPSFQIENFRRPRRHNHITVLMGGVSGERDVSLNSGRAVSAALQQAGYRVSEIDVTANVQNLVTSLLAAKPDAVFNALHGKYGEDGAIQGLLDMMQIPYSHSGRLTSSLAMNKAISRDIFAMAGLPIAPGRVLPRAEYNQSVQKGINPLLRPYIIKPLAEGSSLGIELVRGQGQARLLDTDKDRIIFGDEILLEEFIPGRELTVGVIGTAADAVSLGAIEIRHPKGFFDYEAKYQNGVAEHIIPPELPPAVMAHLQEVAIAAHRVLGCRSLSRSDFRLDESNPSKPRLILLEVNSQPGMTELSLVPDLARALGFSFADLVTYLVEEAKWD